jgi:single-strand DNA-binding protein
MARDLNRVQLIGHLGGDPAIQYLDNGLALTTFTLATNQRYPGDHRDAQDETEWHRIVAWGKLAELCGQLLHKGTRVYVEGRLRTHRWEEVDTGEVRAALEILIHDLIVFDQRSNPLRSAPTDADELPFSP